MRGITDVAKGARDRIKPARAFIGFMTSHLAVGRTTNVIVLARGTAMLMTSAARSWSGVLRDPIQRRVRRGRDGD